MSVLAFAMHPALLNQLPMQPRKSSGIVVARLLATALGSSWDLLPGDVLYSLNGQPLTSVDQLNKLLAAKPPGETVVFQMARDGQLRFLKYPIPSR